MADEKTEITPVVPPATDSGKDPAPSQTPIQAELVKEKARQERTEREKAEFNLRKNAERLKELGGDPTQILGGVKQEPEETTGEIPDWYKREKSKDVQKTALQMADGIIDPEEKSLTKQYLSTRIVPSENPEDDFRLALAAVHALKNKQIVEILGNRRPLRVTASGGSQSTAVEEAFEPTAEEANMMKPPFSLSKEKILEARKKAQK